MFKNFIFSATIAALLIAGCDGASHDFKIRFNDIQGLRKNDPVFFDNTAIGKVTDIDYTDAGSYLVGVSIEDQYSALPKDSSTFYIDSNPGTEDREAIHIIQIKAGGNMVKENAVVEGQPKYAALYGRIADNFRKNIDELQAGLTEFFKDLQNLSENEQIKLIERQLDEILAEIGSLSRQMKHKLETEVLPQIKEHIKELKRRLEKNGKQEELKNVEKKFETISAKLEA